MSDLKEIQSPVEAELHVFEEKFRAAMKSNILLLDRVMHYFIKRKGKQIRPLFVLLCAKTCGEVNESTYTAASLIELLHSATLVHDDVVDDAYMRRGMFSINALWQNKIAVLIGDYLLAKGLLLSLDKNAHEALRITSMAVKEMSEGELLQIEKARRLDIEEDIYYEIIRKKTASLIASACSAGAASTTDNANTVEQMRLFGEKTGIAFQIKDDLLDYGNDDTGKPHGIDIRERKMTLPLIYALNQAGKKDKRRIIYIVKNENRNKKKVDEVIRFVEESGGIVFAREAMQKFREEAFGILRQFPDNESRQALEELVRFTTERNK